MKSTRDKPDETLISVRIPLSTKEALDAKAKAQHRSTVGHVRYLIDSDLKAAA